MKILRAFSASTRIEFKMGTLEVCSPPPPRQTILLHLEHAQVKSLINASKDTG